MIHASFRFLFFRIWVFLFVIILLNILSCLFLFLVLRFQFFSFCWYFFANKMIMWFVYSFFSKKKFDNLKLVVFFFFTNILSFKF